MTIIATAFAALAARRVGARARAAGLAGLSVVALVVLAVPPGRAQSPGEGAPQADALARRAGARIDALQREADALASRERTLLGDLRTLEIERDLHAAKLDQLTADLLRLETDLADTTTGIDRLERDSQAQVQGLTARMVEIYKLGNGGYLRLLLNVDDLRSISRAYRFVSALQSADRLRVVEYQRTLAALRQARANLTQRRAQLLRAQDEVARAREAAGRAAAAHEDLIRRIDQRRDLAAQLVGELQTARQQLQRTLDDASLGAPADAVPALPLRPFKGDLDWPAPGPVAARFGIQKNGPFHTTTVSNGIRLETVPWTPVRAIHDGTVTFAEAFQGFGTLVIVDHGGLAFSLYGYLAEVGVAAGARVSRGYPIGTTGFALDGSPALYFELRIDGKPVDPLQWLKPR
jgi:septal ring factor EnvC (AmiA/AmiB activator)